MEYGGYKKISDMPLEVVRLLVEEYAKETA